MIGDFEGIDSNRALSSAALMGCPIFAACKPGKSFRSFMAADEAHPLPREVQKNVYKRYLAHVAAF